MPDPSDDLPELAESEQSLDARLLDRVASSVDCALGRADAAAAELPADAPFADRLAALLGTLTAAVASDRDLARLCLLEAPGLGAEALARRDAAVSRLAALLAREIEASGGTPAPMATEMAAGGIHEMLGRRLATADRLDPAELAADLASLWLPVLTGGRQ